MFWFCWCSTSGWYVQFQEFTPSTWYWSCCSQPHSHSSTLGLWPTALQSLSKSWVLWICGFHWMLVSLLCVISLLCSPPHNFCILLLTSFTCAWLSLFICTCLNFLPIAYPPSSVWCKWLLCTWLTFMFLCFWKCLRSFKRSRTCYTIVIIRYAIVKIIN